MSEHLDLDMEPTMVVPHDGYSYADLDTTGFLTPYGSKPMLYSGSLDSVPQDMDRTPYLGPDPDDFSLFEETVDLRSLQYQQSNLNHEEQLDSPDPLSLAANPFALAGSALNTCQINHTVKVDPHHFDNHGGLASSTPGVVQTGFPTGKRVSAPIPAVEDLGIGELTFQGTDGPKVRKRPSLARVVKKPSLKTLRPRRSKANLTEEMQVTGRDFGTALHFEEHNTQGGPSPSVPQMSQPALRRQVAPRPRRESAPATSQRPRMDCSSLPPGPSSAPVLRASQPALNIDPSVPAILSTPRKQQNMHAATTSPSTIVASTNSPWRPLNANGASPTPAARYRSSAKLVAEASEFGPAKGVWHQQIQTNPNSPVRSNGRGTHVRPPPVQLPSPRSPRKSASLSNMRRDGRKKPSQVQDMSSAMNQFQVELKPKTNTQNRPGKPHKLSTRQTAISGMSQFDSIQNLSTHDARQPKPSKDGAPRILRRDLRSAQANSAGSAILPSSNSAERPYARTLYPNGYARATVSDKSVAAANSDQWHPPSHGQVMPPQLMFSQLQHQKIPNYQMQRPRLRAVASQPLFGSNSSAAFATKMRSMPSPIEGNSVPYSVAHHRPSRPVENDPFLHQGVDVSPQQVNIAPPHLEAPSGQHPAHESLHYTHESTVAHIQRTAPRQIHDALQSSTNQSAAAFPPSLQEQHEFSESQQLVDQRDGLGQQDRQDPQEPCTPEDFFLAQASLPWRSHSEEAGASYTSRGSPNMAEFELSHRGGHGLGGDAHTTDFDGLNEFTNWNTVDVLDLDNPWNFMDPMSKVI